MIVEKEAQMVRAIYNRFLETESATEVARDMNDLNYRTKSWIATSGKLHKGGKFSKRGVEHILKNPIYTGKIRHKGKVYDGIHKAIISAEMWGKVQEAFKHRKPMVLLPKSRVTPPPLLKGITTLQTTS